MLLAQGIKTILTRSSCKYIKKCTVMKTKCYCCKYIDKAINLL